MDPQVIVDCAAGAESVVPLSDEEASAIQARQAQAAADRAAQEAAQNAADAQRQSDALVLYNALTGLGNQEAANALMNLLGLPPPAQEPAP